MIWLTRTRQTWCGGEYMAWNQKNSRKNVQRKSKLTSARKLFVLSHGVLVSVVEKNLFRACFHNDVGDEGLEAAIKAVRSLAVNT